MILYLLFTVFCFWKFICNKYQFDKLCLHGLHDHGSDENEEVRVEMGGVNLEKDDPAKQFLEVEKIIVHENYTETAEALYNDIGQWFSI